MCRMNVILHPTEVRIPASRRPTSSGFRHIILTTVSQISNRYVVKVYNHQATHLFMYGLPEDLEIAFKDHSDEIPIHDKSGKRIHIAVSVALPDPELLRLHAALAGVFHLSGAVDVFRLIARRADGDAFMQSVVEPEGDQL